MQGQQTASEKDTSLQLRNAKCSRYRRRQCPSPCAPQVENYVLDVIPIPSGIEQGPLMVEPHESAPQAEQLESDPEEEDGQTRTISFTKTPIGAPKSVVFAAKKAAGSTSRRVPLAPTTNNIKSSERIVRCNKSTSALTTTTRSK